MRDVSIITIHAAEYTETMQAVPFHDIGEGWQEIFKQIGGDVLVFTTAEYGVGEEVIAWIQYRAGNRIGHLVQMEESLRPSTRIYHGPNEGQAKILFWEYVTKHTRDM